LQILDLDEKNVENAAAYYGKGGKLRGEKSFIARVQWRLLVKTGNPF